MGLPVALFWPSDARSLSIPKYKYQRMNKHKIKVAHVSESNSKKTCTHRSSNPLSALLPLQSFLDLPAASGASLGKWTVLQPNLEVLRHVRHELELELSMPHADTETHSQELCNCDAYATHFCNQCNYGTLHFNTSMAGFTLKTNMASIKSQLNRKHV